MKENYIFIVLADMHIGQYNPSEYYSSEVEKILDGIEKIDRLDALFIAGDFYHANYSIDSPESKYGLIIMTRLASICERKGAKLRVIKGTKSHDSNQLESFEFISRNKIVDYKYYDKVDEELIFPNCNILYIPEEYIEDKNEYYKEYFSKNDTYDMIVFHGMFEKAIPVIHNSESELHLPKAPIFTTSDVKNCCKGLVMGGHVHKHMIIDDMIYYVGSLSRSSQGEEDDKGYCVVSYTPKTAQYIIKFIKNDYAKLYMGIKVGKTFNTLPVEDMIKHIETIKASLNCDFLRVDIENDNKDEKCQANMTILREHYQTKRGVTIRVNLGRKRIEDIKEEDDEVDELTTKFGFLMDGTAIEYQFMKYAKMVFDKNLDIEDIKRELN